MVTKLIRRTHMYLALFMTPWVLMYALSTLVMNHHEALLNAYGPPAAPFEKEREVMLPAGSVPESAAPAEQATAVLQALGMDGVNSVQKRPDGALVINRQETFEPRRVTYTPADGKAVVEKQPWGNRAFLERMHRRRGFDRGYAADETWAYLVDIFLGVMVFWVLSGLWMWWTLKPTRLLGALSAVGGFALFAWLVAVL